jgi:DNA end-binding protein Ku
VPERLDDSDLRSRAIWSGMITFGLVSVPVNLFPASRPSRTSLRMVDADGTPLQRRYVCPAHDRETEVEWDDLVRGYELADDEFVVVTDDELEALEPKRSREIDLRRFVPVEQLDPRFFERGYYLTPADESTKAYQLLAAIMEKSGRAGIATFVMRGKEYLVALVAENGILRAETLRFQDEIRSVADIGLPARPRLKAADVKKMEAAIRKASTGQLAPSELEDRYAERLLELVRKKERKQEDVVAVPEQVSEGGPAGEIIDLMEVLKQSLRKPGGTRKTARTSARKRKTA